MRVRAASPLSIMRTRNSRGDEGSDVDPSIGPDRPQRRLVVNDRRCASIQRARPLLGCLAASKRARGRYLRSLRTDRSVRGLPNRPSRYFRDDVAGALPRKVVGLQVLRPPLQFATHFVGERLAETTRQDGRHRGGQFERCDRCLVLCVEALVLHFREVLALRPIDYALLVHGFCLSRLSDGEPTPFSPDAQMLGHLPALMAPHAVRLDQRVSAMAVADRARGPEPRQANRRP